MISDIKLLNKAKHISTLTKIRGQESKFLFLGMYLLVLRSVNSHFSYNRLWNSSSPWRKCMTKV